MLFSRFFIAIALFSALLLPTLTQAATPPPTGIYEGKSHKGDNGPRPKPGPREDGDDD